MADHPLRPATDRRLGRPLPHQQANRTQAPPQALLRALDLSRHAVLAAVSRGCPPPKDRCLRVTHPSATDSRSCPCDLHVLSMPPAFALSQDQTLRFIPSPNQYPPKRSISPNQERTDPSTSVRPPIHRPKSADQKTSSKAFCNASKRHISKTPQTINRHAQDITQNTTTNHQSIPKQEDAQDAANVSLPSL